MLVFDSFIGAHYYDENEENAALQVVHSKSLFRYDGPNLLRKTEEFETAFSQKIEVPYALACSSGAAALKLGCVALGIGIGDEVIMSPFTFIASAGAILASGACIRFVDIDESFNIDPMKIEKAINSKTKAIMAIHMQGIPCDMEKINWIAKKHNLYILEDCAQAMMSSFQGKYVGTYGDVAAFSLQENKIITCGEGGVFCCREEEVFLRARQYHDNGGVRTGNQYPRWDTLESSFGENFKITEIQSAIALVQLKKIKKIIDKQKHIYTQITDSLHNRSLNLRKVQYESDITPISLCFIFETVDANLIFREKMKREGVVARAYPNKPINTFNTFQTQKSWHDSGFPYVGTKVEGCELTLDLYNRSSWIPLSPLIEENDIAYIIDTLNSFSVVE